MTNYILMGICLLMVIICSVAFIRFIDIKANFSRENPNRKGLTVWVILSLIGVVLFLTAAIIILINPMGILSF